MKIINYCLYLYILLKPFYILKSGNIQIADLLIIPAFILLIIYNNKDKKIILPEVKSLITNRNFLLVAFVGYVCIINTIYFVIYGSFEFITSSLYYIFIAMGLYVFSFAFKQNNFIRNILRIFKIDIVIQFVILILNLGRNYDSSRYMGTFNDPNQLAFFMFLSVCFIFICENLIKNKTNNLFYYILAFFVVVQTASVGMFLAFGILYIILIVKYIKKNKEKIKVFLPKLIIPSTIIIIIALILSLMKIDVFSFLKSDNGQIEVMVRLTDKLNRFFGFDSGANFFQERGYDKIFNYPIYLIFGAGQGFYERFTNAYHLNEIHATIPSIMFAYGIIPSFILFKWVYENLKNTMKVLQIAYIAILVESFTLLNQRQLLLWIIIILPISYLSYRKIRNDIETVKSIDKVAIFMPSALVGGVQRIIINLANGLAKNNKEVSLIIADGQGEALKSINKNVNVLDLKVKNGTGDIKTVIGFFKLLKTILIIRPNFLVGAPGFSTVVCVLVKIVSNLETKVIVIVDNKLSLLKKRRIYHRISYYMYKLIYKFADAIVIASKSATKDFKECFKIKNSKIHTIYNPLIDEEKIDSIIKKPNHKWFKKEHNVILSVGRLVKEKDYETLIEAFNKLNVDNLYRLLILGEGPQRKSLQELIEKLKINKYVDLHGQVNNPLQYMKYSNLYVSSSVSEGFPTVMVEALSVGLPVVATNCDSGGPSEILDNGRYGIICDYSDEDALCDAIKEALETNYEKNRLIKRGNYFSINSSVNNYIKLFEQLNIGGDINE